MLSILFENAIDLDWHRDNPAMGIEKLKTGSGHQPWQPSSIEVFRKNLTGRHLRIFDLALGTGHRASDLTRMEWSHIEDGGIWVTQNKTSKRLWIPIPTSHAETLRNVPLSLSYIPCGEHGRKLNYDQIQKAMITERKILGLQAQTLHGLRYSAASELAEAGCTDHQTATITGHESLSMVQNILKERVKSALPSRLKA
ncbi:tyrosine-type recombinase/integrase [Falsiruegeria litorea]|nr:tyrosine-type recombinase/integrase [Falsiruegeria litorea]